MEGKLSKSVKTYLKVALPVFLLDLITKNLAEKFLYKPYDPLPVLKLYLIHNRGVAFGLLSDLPDFLRIPILILVPIVALFITFFYSVLEGKRFTALCMGLIGGGALGNLYDRIFLGEVRDFIHLHIGNYYWPAFNIADASITVGVFLLFAKYFAEKLTFKNLKNGTG